MSTSLAQLSSDVMTLVKRPDLVDSVAIHIKNAILKLHTLDFFLPDILESALTFNAPATQYTLDTKSLISRWRKIKYLNVIDPLTGNVLKKCSPIYVNNFTDDYGYIKDYVFYEAGNFLQIRASGQEQYYGFGAYLYPDTTLSTPSWIADSFPYAIQYEAMRTLYKSIGFDEQSAEMEKLVAEAVQVIKTTGLTTIGE